jgi:NADH:ubiquinone oxidoreductase subunit 6 (subunit J)
VTIGTSIFLMVVGAILRYAVTWTIAGIDLLTLGLILMVAGAVTAMICLVRMMLPERHDARDRWGGHDR